MHSHEVQFDHDGFATDVDVTATDAAVAALDARLDVVEAAGTTYTVTWTGTTTNPVLFDGTLVGRHLTVGKRVDYTIKLTIGAGTTFGSGFWVFTLPSTVAGNDWMAPAWCNDSSAGAHYRATARSPGGGNTIARTYVADGAAATAILSPTAPFTWAVGDMLEITGTYEKA